ncbi:penicillin-binding transpeptidase domain-containing protein [Paenibacillus sp. GYB003]|uniref:penicillin-binding transpeptidase domain-containing protein n=1 Tax=Paenibacillus sp. GYB003 TaxID=2994392 RepID=UPI002F967614
MNRWIGYIAAVVFAAALGGCQKEAEPPAAVMEAYVSAWRQLNYAGMYGALSPDAQARITEDEFAKRYGAIYEGIEASGLAVDIMPKEPAKEELDKGEVTIPYRVAMETVAGPLRFDHQAKLVKAETADGPRWTIAWEPSLLFPHMADGDKVRVTTAKGVRGEIVDRNGNGLAVNGTAPQVGIVPGRLGDAAERTKATLADKLGFSVEAINGMLGAKWVKPDSFVPLAFVAESAAEQFRAIPGADVQSRDVRVYPYGESAAHVTGYIGEISAEELERRKEQGYAAGDLIGKAGLEQLFEERLRGKDGARISIVDGAGKTKETIARKDASAGETIRLTIDADVQRALYDELKQDAASAAAIRPATGDILALVSSPAYDPNAFQRGLSAERYNAWNRDPKQPFLNRFTKAYAPGSAFKLVTAAIGLDSRVLDPAEEKPITGLKWSKDGSWGNYYVKRVNETSPVNLQKALVYSDNIYFAQVALELGRQTFAAGSAKFGIGERLPVSYPFQKSQLSNTGIRSDIQLADSGYGQGEVTMTTLHAALVFSALVNEGDMAYPVLTEEEAAGRGKRWKPGAMAPETAELLRRDLVQAVAGPGAPGHGAYIPGASIAGKTGTAEFKRSKEEDGLENGWFVGFDAAGPQLLLAVMVEDVKGRGGSGYVTAKAKRVFQFAMKR